MAAFISGYNAEMARRFQFSLKTLLVVMLVAAAFFGGMAVQEFLDEPASRPGKPRIPSTADIESMTAEAYCHLLSPIAKDVPPYRVDEEYYDELLRHFQEAEVDEYASQEDREVGTMAIRYKGGQILRICWFWSGHKGRMSFSWGGIRYVTRGDKFAEDEAIAFDSIVRRIAK